jgi:hypothetical protein
VCRHLSHLGEQRPASFRLCVWACPRMREDAVSAPLSPSALPSQLSSSYRVASRRRAAVCHWIGRGRNRNGGAGDNSSGAPRLDWPGMACTARKTLACKMAWRARQAGAMRKRAGEKGNQRRKQAREEERREQIRTRRRPSSVVHVHRPHLYVAVVVIVVIFVVVVVVVGVAVGGCGCVGVRVVFGLGCTLPGLEVA